MIVGDGMSLQIIIFLETFPWHSRHRLQTTLLLWISKNGFSISWGLICSDVQLKTKIEEKQTCMCFRSCLTGYFLSLLVDHSVIKQINLLDGDVVKVDVALPGYPPSQIIKSVVTTNNEYSY